MRRIARVFRRPVTPTPPAGHDRNDIDRRVKFLLCHVDPFLEKKILAAKRVDTIKISFPHPIAEMFSGLLFMLRMSQQL